MNSVNLLWLRLISGNLTSSNIGGAQNWRSAKLDQNFAETVMIQASSGSYVVDMSMCDSIPVPTLQFSMMAYWAIESA